MKTINSLTLENNSLNNAQNAIKDFELHADTQSFFLNGFNKQIIVAELSELINNPDSFHQGLGTNFSGDAVIVSQYILKHTPDIYVNTIIDFYTKGFANYDNGKCIIKFEPSQNIRKWAFNTEKNKFAKATSQLFLFSLREHFNEIDYYRGAQNTIWASSFLSSIWGISSLSAQQRIAEELLGFDCEKFGEHKKKNNKPDLEKIQNDIAKGNLVILQVNREYLKCTEKSERDAEKHQQTETEDAHYINLVQLKTNGLNSLWMQWWNCGAIHQQSIALSDFNAMFHGGLSINNPENKSQHY